MPDFEVEFVDGSKVVKTTDTADQAKAQAKTDAFAKVPRDTPRSAPEVKVKSVTRLSQ